MIATVSCLVCDAELEVAAATEKGEIVECASCGQEHEVVDATDGRVAVELAPEVEEDWGE
ncbi:lysine biosynthesis protein LysW [Saccharothrix sp. S26]|uniref:lysine biosynthesis protein LysW n=1 Tax=Saccharothrix sp. S26 TaxID=2907215 RepID=UPI001F2555B8|nr:lysine biosynthesis protein LysW [Saccharothrix sp. S26]MCE6998262.1 lysine biosynthesis protein LysW [Saccharothrix sp. S26]